MIHRWGLLTPKINNVLAFRVQMRTIFENIDLRVVFVIMTMQTNSSMIVFDNIEM